MTHETTPQTVERMLSPMDGVLRDPGGTEKSLDGLQEQIGSQPGLDAAARRAAISALEGQRRAIQAARKAALMAELKAQLKQRFGIAIEFHVLKRRSKKRAKPAGPQPAKQASAPALSEPGSQPEGRDAARWGRGAS